MTRRFLIAAAVATAAAGCGHRAVPRPPIIPHAQWQSQPPLGYAAEATRRNKRAGDSLVFRDLTIGVTRTTVESTGA